MQSVDLLIKEIENKWLGLLHDYVQDLYLGVNIPSHDLQHHLRVWSHCKGIIRSLSLLNHDINESFIQEAIIACLFHDTGLIVDKSEKHGKESRLFCEKFLCHQTHIQERSIKAILDAVEFHDDKSLKVDSNLSNSREVDIVNIVSTSDDIDAFGMIGVFRYIEIYAIRGVDKHKLPNMVLENLSNRFQNLKYTFSYLCKVVDEQEVRYEKARSFFSRVQKAMLESNENDPAIQAYDFIYDGFISHNFSFEQMYMKALSIESSIGFKSYFYDFKNEMDLHK
jgi:HD superfamily phosphodiesterase